MPDITDTATQRQRNATCSGRAAIDLHPFVDSSTIEFRVPVKGRLVRVNVSRETLNQRFGVPEDSEYGLLEVYEAHRDLIDAAVIRRAADGGTGVVKVRPPDLG